LRGRLAPRTGLRPASPFSIYGDHESLSDFISSPFACGGWTLTTSSTSTSALICGDSPSSGHFFSGFLATYFSRN